MDRYDELIERMRKRVWEEGDSSHKIPLELRSRPPLTLDQVESAERWLDFRLPLLIRRIYLEVADGFWGPGYGMSPLLEDVNGGISVVVEIGNAAELGHPPRCLRLSSFGCGYEAYIKYDDPDLPIFLEECDFAGRWPSGRTLETYILGWLNEGDEFVPFEWQPRIPPNAEKFWEPYDLKEILGASEDDSEEVWEILE